MASKFRDRRTKATEERTKSDSLQLFVDISQKAATSASLVDIRPQTLEGYNNMENGTGYQKSNYDVAEVDNIEMLISQGSNFHVRRSSN